MTCGLQLKSSRQFSPGDAKIKSWHDGRVEEDASLTLRNAISQRLWDQVRAGWKGEGRGAECRASSARRLHVSAQSRIRLAVLFDRRSNSVVLPSRWNSERRAVSRSNRISRLPASRTRLCAQPTAASRAPLVTGSTRWSAPDG